MGREREREPETPPILCASTGVSVKICPCHVSTTAMIIFVGDEFYATPCPPTPTPDPIGENISIIQHKLLMLFFLVVLVGCVIVKVMVLLYFSLLSDMQCLI